MLRLIIVMLIFVCTVISRVDLQAESFTFSGISTRIITPTSKKVVVQVTNPGGNELSMSGKIFDITGREVDNMIVEHDFFTDGFKTLTWEPQSNVPTGVYIYQIEGGGKVYNGTVIVAK